MDAYMGDLRMSVCLEVHSFLCYSVLIQSQCIHLIYTGIILAWLPDMCVYMDGDPCYRDRWRCGTCNGW
jgi:hypothetical protein